jgi:hypothetical protein
MRSFLLRTEVQTCCCVVALVVDILWWHLFNGVSWKKSQEKINPTKRKNLYLLLSNLQQIHDSSNQSLLLWILSHFYFKVLSWIESTLINGFSSLIHSHPNKQPNLVADKSCPFQRSKLRASSVWNAKMMANCAFNGLQKRWNLSKSSIKSRDDHATNPIQKHSWSIDHSKLNPSNVASVKALALRNKLWFDAARWYNEFGFGSLFMQLTQD